MGYRPGLPDVLKGATFTVKGGEKIGVCGRTGSGKSTLLSCLFRLTSLRRGAVRIDGLDLASLTLSSLRSALAIIPQDPIFFTGTLRYNLDPRAEVHRCPPNTGPTTAALQPQGPAIARPCNSQALQQQGPRPCHRKALLSLAIAWPCYRTALLSQSRAIALPSHGRAIAM
jgi:hypothetical protein